MNDNNKKISLDSTETVEEKKNSLRPLYLSEFIGQDFIKSNEKKAWLICLTNFGKDECKKFLVNQKDKVVYDEKLNGIHMIMISNLNQ